MPRRYCLLSLLAFSLFGLVISGGGRAQNAPGSVEQAKKEVLKVSEEIDKVVATNDADGIGPYLSEELEYTLQTGEVLGKADWQARMRSKGINMLALKHEVSHVHVFNGDTVVLTGRSESTVIFKGKLSNTPRRFTRTFIKQDGKWLMVAQHVTLFSGQ